MKARLSTSSLSCYNTESSLSFVHAESANRRGRGDVLDLDRAALGKLFLK